MKIPLFKIVVRPLIPIARSWVDGLPIIAFFILFCLAFIFLTRFKKKQFLRHAVQSVSFFFFVIFIHRCLCVIRGWAFGIKEIGQDDLYAFANLCMFVPIIAFTLTCGRLFCGWICPLGFLQEMSGKLGMFMRKTVMHKSSMRFVVAVCLLALLGSPIGLIYILRPSTDFFTENVAAVWGISLLVILLGVIVWPDQEGKFRKIRYVSLALWAALCLASVFITNPWCVMYGNVLDYSSIIGLFCVLLASAIIPMAWCRFLCPAGALLSLITRISYFKIKASAAMKECEDLCHTGALSDWFYSCWVSFMKECEDACYTGALKKGRIDISSCLYCGRCIQVCGCKMEKQ